jgi:hypothetical protein
VFNRTIYVEFFDGVSKKMHLREFEGADAYCLQMLRASFAQECWDKLEA